ncbi:MAG: hypothetical protein JNN11_03070, partial [Candidatus Doudnabacteria bacterium]|nr:hypothetical protein [Candidatus Doudnabacteria bacterium]
LVNPEDNIDTKRNQMTMSFVTTVAAATTTKATMMIDFAMVSIGWVDTSVPAVSTIVVAGVFYDIDESTPYATTTVIKLAVGASVSYSASAVNGVFSFGSVTQPEEGDIMTIWLDTGGGEQASLVFDYGNGCSGGDCTSLSLYRNSVIIDSKNSSTLTNASLAACDNDTGSACGDADIGFVSDGTDLTLTWLNNSLRLPFSSSKFSPGGKITAKNFVQSAGEFNGGTALLTFDNDWIVSGGIATSTSGALRIARNITRSGSGIFNHNNGEVVLLSPWLDTTITGMGTSTTGSFFKFRADIPDKVVKITAGEKLLVNDRFVISGQPGAINKIMSTVPGVKWYISLASTSLVNWAGVADAGCFVGTENPFLTPEARDFGNNGPCWNFVKIGGGGGNFIFIPGDDPSAGGGGGAGIGGGGAGGGGCLPPTAHAVVSGGAVITVDIIFGGSCFADPPNVIFTGGGGSGATAHATVSGGHVVSVIVDDGGSGYATSPVTSFVGEGGSGGGSGQTGGGQGGGGSGGGGGEIP